MSTKARWRGGIVSSARSSDLLVLVDFGRFAYFFRAVRTAAPGGVDDLAATCTGVYQFPGAMRTSYELRVDNAVAGGTARPEVLIALTYVKQSAHACGAIEDCLVSASEASLAMYSRIRWLSMRIS